MSLFESLFDKLESKLMFGNSKQKTFVSQVKALFNGDQVDPQIIWRGLQGPDGQENASFYCLQLFNNLNNCDRKNHLAQVQEKMLATLLAVQFYKNKTPKTNELILGSRKFVDNRVFSHAKWIISYFLRNPNQKYDFTQLYLSRLVFLPKVIDWSKSISSQIIEQLIQSQQYSKKLRQNGQHTESEFNRIKRISYPKPHQIQLRGLTFGHACFHDYIRGNSYKISQQEYKHMNQLLSAYLHAIKDEYNLYQYLPVIVHIIKISIMFYGCPYQNIMKEMMLWAHQIKLVPGKIGEIGQQFFNMLRKEIKIPGSSFRSMIKEDFPDLDERQALFTNRQYYFITNSEDFVSRNDKIQFNQLRKKIIIHILRVAQIDQREIIIFQSLLDNLDIVQVFKLYQKCNKILQLIGNLQNYQKIKKQLKQSLELYIQSTHKKYKHHQQHNLSASHMQKISSQNQLFGSTVLMKPNQINRKLQNIKDHPLGFFPYPNYNIVYVTLNQYLDPKSLYSFQSLVKKFKQNFPKKSYFCSKNKLPIIFYGKRDQFFLFIRPFAEYFQKTSISQLINFKIYYLSKPNLSMRPSIASFIGYNDILYRRVAMNTFKQKLIYPHLQPTPKNRDTIPTQLMNKCLHLYLRQARYNFPLQLFKCQIWREGVQTKYISQNIYFSQSVTMGIFTQAEIIKVDRLHKDQKYYNKEIIDIIARKLKKFEHFTILMEVDYFDRIQNIIIPKKQQFMRVDDIQICSAPRQYFLGRKPNPSKPMLQLTLLPTNNSKLFRKQIINTQNYKEKIGLDELESAFKELLIEMTVKRVKIQNLYKEKPLRIVIDGQLFEGIDKFIIQPAVSFDKQDISIPIQTFVPIS